MIFTSLPFTTLFNEFSAQYQYNQYISI